MQETQKTWIWSLGCEDPVEEEMTPLSSILAWNIVWPEEPGGLQSMGSHRVRHDWRDWASTYSYIYIVHSVTQLSLTLWLHAPLPMEFSRKEYWSGVLFPTSYVVAKLCVTLCDSMDSSTPGFPAPHYLPEFAQLHELLMLSNYLHVYILHTYVSYSHSHIFPNIYTYLSAFLAHLELFAKPFGRYFLAKEKISAWKCSEHDLGKKKINSISKNLLS